MHTFYCIWRDSTGKHCVLIRNPFATKAPNVVDDEAIVKPTYNRFSQQGPTWEISNTNSISMVR